MKFKSLIPLVIVPFVLSGCNNSQDKNKDKNTKEKGVVTLELEGTANPDRKKPYKLSFNYDNAYFNHPATQFDDDLKLLSFAGSCASKDLETADYFFSKMFFDNPHSHGYDIPTSEDTIGYYFAHKTIDDSDLIAVSIRGYNYGKEWANNCTIGATGNHAGFTLRASEIFEDLDSYVTEMTGEDRTTKIWLTGYSRAGGIANVLADKLMADGGDFITGNNLFVYTFEAPAGIATENIVEYPNVFNIINSCDLVTKIPPVQYGFGRCGVDVDIYNEDWENMVYKFDAGIDFPRFHSKSNSYTSESEFVDFFLNLLLAKPDESYETYSLESRETYVNVFEDNIAYFMSFYFSLTNEEVEILKGAFNGLDSSAFLTAFYTVDGLYNLLKPTLDENEIEYDETKLKYALEVLRRYLIGHSSLMLELINADIFNPGINQNTIDNLQRILAMHYPEVTYSLISQQTFAEE